MSPTQPEGGMRSGASSGTPSPDFLAEITVGRISDSVQAILERHERHVLPDLALLEQETTPPEAIAVGLATFAATAKTEADFCAGSGKHLRFGPGWQRYMVVNGTFEPVRTRSQEEILTAVGGSDRQERINDLALYAGTLARVHPESLFRVLITSIVEKSAEQRLITTTMRRYNRFCQVYGQLQPYGTERQRYLAANHERYFSGQDVSNTEEFLMSSNLDTLPDGDFMAHFDAEQAFRDVANVLFSHAIGNPEDFMYGQRRPVSLPLIEHMSRVQSRFNRTASWGIMRYARELQS